MNLELFQRRANIHLSGLRHLIEENMISRGDKSDDCQRRLLLNLLLPLGHALDTVEPSDLIPHTIFREPIASREDAARLLTYLYQHGITFHPDDDPADLAAPEFTADESRELRHRMNEIAEIPGFDPCEFYLELQDMDADQPKPLHPSINSSIP